MDQNESRNWVNHQGIDSIKQGQDGDPVTRSRYSVIEGRRQFLETGPKTGEKIAIKLKSLRFLKAEIAS